MAMPTRTFTGVTGQRSINTAGAEQLSWDLDDAFAMFNPEATLRDGVTPGGIGSANLQSGVFNDTTIGTRTVSQTIATAFSNTGTLTQLLSWIVKAILALTGNVGNWYDTAAASVATLWGKFDATSGHKHTGAANDAPQIAYSSLTGVPPFQTVAYFTPEEYGAVGNGSTDDTIAWQAMLNAVKAAEGGLVLLLSPSKNYLISAPLQYTAADSYNAYPLTILGSGNTGGWGPGTPNEGLGLLTGIGTTIISNITTTPLGYKTGSVPIFDLCGSGNITLENFRIINNPAGGAVSSIGIMTGAITVSGTTYWAQQHQYRNVTIVLPTMGSGHNTTTNTNFNYFGSVAVYNNGAELFTADNCIFRADTPSLFTNQNICAVTSPAGTVSNPIGTMNNINLLNGTSCLCLGGTGLSSDCQFVGVMLDGGGTWGVDDITMSGFYVYQQNGTGTTYAGGYGYGVVTNGNVVNLSISAGFEDDLSRQSVIKSYGSAAKLVVWDLKVNIGGNTTYPLINLQGNTLQSSSINCRTASNPSGQQVFATGDSITADCNIYYDLSNQVVNAVGFGSSGGGGPLPAGATPIVITYQTPTAGTVGFLDMPAVTGKYNYITCVDISPCENQTLGSSFGIWQDRSGAGLLLYLQAISPGVAGSVSRYTFPTPIRNTLAGKTLSVELQATSGIIWQANLIGYVL